MATKNQGIIAKFGGSFLATHENVAQVLGILSNNPRIKVAVVSAPGLRWESDINTTVHLQRWYNAAQIGQGTDCQPRVFSQRFTAIASRYLDSQSYEQYQSELNKELRLMAKAFYEKDPHACSLDYVRTRGEYFMAKLMAQILGWEFVDTIDLTVGLKNDHKYVVPKRDDIDGLIAKALGYQIQDWD